MRVIASLRELPVEIHDLLSITALVHIGRVMPLSKTVLEHLRCTWLYLDIAEDHLDQPDELMATPELGRLVCECTKLLEL